MTAVTDTPPARPSAPHLTIGGRPVPVVLPKRGDPRLKLSAIIMTLQVLGQTVLGFKLSVAQILVSIGVCAAIEATVTYRREHAIVWPASGILTGNSVAFILRASGTRPGDWWSLNGIEFFVLACGLSLLSKHLIRAGDRHVFNPSNVGIVWVLLVIGPTHVFPQYLWWGPLEAPVIAALVVIAVGAVWILPPIRMVSMAASYLVVFAALVALLAATGHRFAAIWHDGDIAGVAYFVHIVASPELLIFVFFMMSDPQTAPRTGSGRIAYGAGTAALAAVLASFQTTEFGVKLAILASLTVTCALVPPLRAFAAQRRATATLQWRALVRRLRDPVVIAVAVVASAAVVDTVALADNEQLILIERGLSGSRNPQ